MLFLLVLIVVIATSIWVFTDAKGRIDSGEHLEPIESATGWAWGCILLWIVFFPWYLMRKSNSTVTTKPTLTRIVEQVTNDQKAELFTGSRSSSDLLSPVVPAR